MLGSDIWFVAATRIGFWTWIWPKRHWIGTGNGLVILMLEKLSLFCLTGLNNSGAIDVKQIGFIWGKYLLKWLGLSFSSKLDLGSLIVYIAKTASKNSGMLIHPMSLLSHEVALHLHKSTIRLCIEYCHILGVAPNCYFNILDNVQKRFVVLLV